MEFQLVLINRECFNYCMCKVWVSNYLAKDVKLLVKTQNFITLCYAAIVKHCLTFTIHSYAFLLACMYITILYQHKNDAEFSALNLPYGSIFFKPLTLSFFDQNFFLTRFFRMSPNVLKLSVYDHLA